MAALHGVGWERRKEKACCRQASAAHRHSTMHSLLSPARYSMLSPKLPSGPRRSISSQECKEPKSYLGVDPSYTGDEEHNAMLCRCLKQKNKLRSRQQLLSSGPRVLKSFARASKRPRPSGCSGLVVKVLTCLAKASATNPAANTADGMAFQENFTASRWPR